MLFIFSSHVVLLQGCPWPLHALFSEPFLILCLSVRRWCQDREFADLVLCSGLGPELFGLQHKPGNISNWSHPSIQESRLVPDQGVLLAKRLFTVPCGQMMFLGPLSWVCGTQTATAVLGQRRGGIIPKASPGLCIKN